MRWIALPRTWSKMNKDVHVGGGSLTALPIIETQVGDVPHHQLETVSAYVPTNVLICML